MDLGETVSDIVEGAQALAHEAIEEAKRLAASEQGKQVRHMVATGLIVAAPAVVSLPILRRTRIGKVIELAGGAALVVTLAEKIRDWDPDRSSA
jgi:hypothetical protein